MPEYPLKPDVMHTGITHKFTSAELHVLLKDLVISITEKEEIEAEKTESLSGYKTRLDRVAKEINRIKNACQRGEENRTVEVQLVRNFEKGVRQYWTFDDDAVVNKFGGLGTLRKLVQKEPLTPSDHAIQLELLEEENAKRETEGDIIAGGSKKGKEPARQKDGTIGKVEKPGDGAPKKPKPSKPKDAPDGGDGSTEEEDARRKDGDHPRPDEDGGM